MALDAKDYGITKWSGTIYAGRIETFGQRATEFKKFGEVAPMTLTVNTQATNIYSRQVETANQIIDSVLIPSDDGFTGSMTGSSWYLEGLLYAFGGDWEAGRETEESFLLEEFIFPKPGVWKNLGGLNVSDVTVSLPPAIEGDDPVPVPAANYQVETNMGLITSTTGGTLADGTMETIVAGKFAAQSSSGIIRIGTNLKHLVELKGLLKNEISGELRQVEIFQALISSSAEIPIISEKDTVNEKLQFNISMQTPPWATYPGRIVGYGKA